MAFCTINGILHNHILDGCKCQCFHVQSKCPAVVNYSNFPPASKVSQLFFLRCRKYVIGNNWKLYICIIRSVHFVDMQDDFNILLKHSHRKSFILFVNSHGQNIVFGIYFEGMSIICLFFYIRIFT